VDHWLPVISVKVDLNDAGGDNLDPSADPPLLTVSFYATSGRLLFTRDFTS